MKLNNTVVCYQCYEHVWDGDLIDGLCVNCYSDRQERIFIEVFGQQWVDELRAEEAKTDE